MQLRRVPHAFGHVPTSPALSPGARTRLQALTVWQQTDNWRLASQTFGVSRATLYRWRHQYRPCALCSLEPRSRRPHRMRRSRLPSLVIQRLQSYDSNIPGGDEKSCVCSWPARACTSQAKPLIECWPGSERPGSSSSHLDAPSLLIGESTRGPMPPVNRAPMPSSPQEISSKSIRWMSVPFRVSF